MKNGGRRMEFPFYLEFTPNFTYHLISFLYIENNRADYSRPNESSWQTTDREETAGTGRGFDHGIVTLTGIIQTRDLSESSSTHSHPGCIHIVSSQNNKRYFNL